MWEYLRDLLSQRAMLVPAACVVVGIALHLRGAKITDPDKASMQQQVAAVFDALFVISTVSAARHRTNQNNIEKTVDKVNEIRPPDVAPLEINKPK